MAVKQRTQNMGKPDRLIRGTLGGFLLLNGLSHIQHSTFRRIETLVGGAFLVYGLSGFDPLLKLFGASTIPGAENNVLNLMRQAAPGQGINPMLTQQAVPKQVNQRKKRIHQTVAQATTIP